MFPADLVNWKLSTTWRITAQAGFSPVAGYSVSEIRTLLVEMEEMLWFQSRCRDC